LVRKEPAGYQTEGPKTLHRNQAKIIQRRGNGTNEPSKKGGSKAIEEKRNRFKLLAGPDKKRSRAANRGFANSESPDEGFKKKK